MGEPKTRLNQQIESVRNRILLEKAIPILFSVAMLLPASTKTGKGRKPSRQLGLILADKGYSNRKNASFVANKKVPFFHLSNQMQS
ncbi:hypothetical protein J4232_02020 [Candidatus Woesearchaeota archaeon]|nr:hypothetical protein [Candidatus Woesearchaeota archaeon]